MAACMQTSIPLRRLMLWSFPLLIGCGAILGMTIGMIADFGIDHPAKAMQMNSHMFADQYALGLVITNLIVIFGVFTLAVGIVMETTRSRRAAPH